MKEFIFYLSGRETRDLVNRLLSKGYILVPKVPFPVGPYPRIAKTLPDEPTEKIFPNLSLLIFGPFSSEEPVVRVLPSGKLARISDNQGGPMIALHLPGAWPQKDGSVELAAGMLSLRNEFWNAQLSKKIGPTPEIQDHYAGLVKELKLALFCFGKNWIGAEAADLFQAGKAFFRPPSVNKEVREGLDVNKARAQRSNAAIKRRA